MDKFRCDLGDEMCVKYFFTGRLESCCKVRMVIIFSWMTIDYGLGEDCNDDDKI